MSVLNVHFVDGPVDLSSAVMDVHADNLPEGGSSFSGDYNDLVNKPTIPAAYTLPAATTAAIGGVKKASAVAAVAAADSAAAAADSVTKAEFDKVVAEANETKRQLNALISAGKVAGWLA